MSQSPHRPPAVPLGIRLGSYLLFGLVLVAVPAVWNGYSWKELVGHFAAKAVGGGVGLEIVYQLTRRRRSAP